MTKIILKPRKRLGRMRRGPKLGKIVPIKGAEDAGKSKSETEKPEKQ